MKLFISYRRKSWPFIERLADKLGELIEGDIFIDYKDIDDTDFERSILLHLRESDIVLVAVTELTFAPDKIHDDDDWVRREIALALELEKPIILILVDNLKPPVASKLPQNIRDITRKQGIVFYPEYFEAAVQSLAKFVTKVLPSVVISEDESLSVEKSHNIELQSTTSPLPQSLTKETNKPDRSLDNEKLAGRQNDRKSNSEPSKSRSLSQPYIPMATLYPLFYETNDQPNHTLNLQRYKKQLEYIRRFLLFGYDLRNISKSEIDMIESDLRAIIEGIESIRYTNEVSYFESVDGIQALIRKAITNLALASDFLEMRLSLKNREQVYRKLGEVPHFLKEAIMFFKF